MKSKFFKNVSTSIDFYLSIVIYAFK